jgi:hypothetical protein
MAAKKLYANNMAITFGNTIYLHQVTKEDFIKNERWLKHEMCHINQFKKYGFLKFIILYLWESSRHGYHQNKYEVEAREAEIKN